MPAYLSYCLPLALLCIATFLPSPTLRYYCTSPHFFPLSPTLRFYIYQSFKASYRKQQAAKTTSRADGSGADAKPPVHLMLLFGGISGLVAQVCCLHGTCSGHLCCEVTCFDGHSGTGGGTVLLLLLIVFCHFFSALTPTTSLLLSLVLHTLQTITYPLDVIRRRMQVHSILASTSQLGKGGGGPRSVSAPVISPPSAAAPLSKPPPPSTAVGSRILSVTPLMSVHTSSSASCLAGASSLPSGPAAPQLTTLSILKSILREEGVRGLFRWGSTSHSGAPHHTLGLPITLWGSHHTMGLPKISS